MKRRYANLLLRLAFRIFRRYHDQLPSELNGIIWGEMTRKPRKHGQDYYSACELSGYEPACSTCVREAEEDRTNRETVQRWLSGRLLTKEVKSNDR